MVVQKELDAFYSIHNLVTLDIKMAKWDDLRKAVPRGGFGFRPIQTNSIPPKWLDRYDWMTAESVTLSGSKFPPAPKTFTHVPIIKKSYGGSFSESKPSFKLNFAKTPDAEAVEQLIGTKSLTLNNCKQDPSFVRQPLGYQLLQQAGLPAFRCNFAKVTVNGADAGVFVNLEPLKKPFLERCFAISKGNIYEVEFDPSFGGTQHLGIDQGNVSFDDSPDPKADPGDVKVAAGVITTQHLPGANQVIDIDAFIRLQAMESLLKHWDGYTQQMNNAYLYNDKKPVFPSAPSPADIKLKFIPSGIDQILQDPRAESRAAFHIGEKCNLTQLLLADPAGKKKLFDQIRTYANTLFSDVRVGGEISLALGGMELMLTAAGAKPHTGTDSLSAAIGKVREQVGVVRVSALKVVGDH